MPSDEEVRLNLATRVLRASGELRFRARGSSMIPSLCPGDILLVRREPMAGIRRGDVVLFLREERFCAHRVVRTRQRGGESSLITQGDALRGEDPAVSEDEFLGRVPAAKRGRSEFHLSRRPGAGARLLAWAFRRSDLLARSFLRWHTLRGRFAQRCGPPAAEGGFAPECG